MRWMLDTNTCIDVMKDQPPQVRQRLRRIAVGEVAISAIVLAELRFGVRKSRRREQSGAALADFLRYCLVLAWPQEAVDLYAETRAALERCGTPIGPNDLLIAAHALWLNATLVTSNSDEFGRVEGLTIENWRT
jgi:tRNA(fMet)-specific endonuclease VapC